MKKKSSVGNVMPTIPIFKAVLLVAFVSVFSFTLRAQEIETYGKVLDNAGESLPGVTIRLKGTANGAITDLDGNYKISATSLDQVLLVSFVGMVTQEVQVVNGELNITLLEDEQLLEDVVVTGYQELKVNEAAGSYNFVDMDNFSMRMAPNITTTLEGLSPSLVVSANPSNPEGEKKLTIRGISTLGSSSPLIVVDGFPYNGGLSSINPYEIKTINFLKDAASASIYGAKSANGVIVITTKRGSKNGGFEVRYSSTTQVGEKSDIDYLMNRLSSSDMVDVEMVFFEQNKDKPWIETYQKAFEENDPNLQNRFKPFSKAIKLMLENKEGRLSDADLKAQLELLRKTDNREDLDKLLLQSPLYTEHNLAASFTADRMKIRTSLNYFNDKSSFVGNVKEGVRYNMNALMDVSDRFKIDLLGNINLGRSERYKDNPTEFLKLSPYELFYNKDNIALAVTRRAENNGTNNRGVFGGKDDFAIKQLIDLGLLDETYRPASDYRMSKRFTDDWRARFQAQMRLNIIEGLDGVLAFNLNKSAAKNKTIAGVNSWEMRHLINNMTKKTTNASGDVVKGNLLIPIGDRIGETRSNTTNYLLRGQLHFNKYLNDNHKIIAMLGSEVQANKFTATEVDRVGYGNDNLYIPVDYASLSNDISGLFIPGESVEGGLSFNNQFIEKEDRFFSLYANTNYSFMDKYILSGSIRIDQSNLFGTDPKYRYKPFWSVGAKWRIAEESFLEDGLFSKLDLQLSYGVNGNVSHENGPFDITQYGLYSLGGNSTTRGLAISKYAVPDLRWEQTQIFNAGIQTSFANERINLNFDYYRKNTPDALASTKGDPTLGSDVIERNRAGITNNGYEIGLQTLNIKTSDFKWSTFLNLNFNKSKVTKVYEGDENVYFTAGSVENRAGYAPSSLFVFHYAGVDTAGNGQLKKGNGEIIRISPSIYDGGEFSPFNLKRDDLEFAGTVIPKLVARFTNNLSYRNLTLSFMFVYQGGHVMLRDSYNGEILGGRPGTLNKEAANAWKEKGDENKPNVVPRLGSATYASVIRASTKNVIDGDFVRLRDVVLSYSLPKSVLNNIGLHEVTFNVRGNNLYLWTKNKEGIDPESHGLGYRYFPVSKSVSLGVNVTF